ncbi:MAG: hypothetical protein JJE47_16565 [Acidimicrobiia bacterium]|nr:hypothetical protein [Acidimicrobiia bacterium]
MRSTHTTVAPTTTSGFRPHDRSGIDATDGQSDAMRAAMAAFGPLMASPPEMSVTTPVAAIGFDI